MARQSRTTLRKETGLFLDKLARNIVAADAARIAAERARAKLASAMASVSSVSNEVNSRLASMPADAHRPDTPSHFLELAFQREARVARSAGADLLAMDEALSAQLEVLALAIADMRHDCANKMTLSEHLLGSSSVASVRLPYPSEETPFPMSHGVRSSDDLLVLAARLTDGTRALATRAVKEQRDALKDVKDERWAISQLRGIPRADRPTAADRGAQPGY
mmetsp:Transcript_14922/g.37731  ORF Transcript_14922/g.37731 Transcript_14922/m.37731 type:complete len:221 (-) Transcript_14922:115-777(-)